jgi:hypothetical protein
MAQRAPSPVLLVFQTISGNPIYSQECLSEGDLLNTFIFYDYLLFSNYRELPEARRDMRPAAETALSGRSRAGRCAGRGAPAGTGRHTILWIQLFDIMIYRYLPSREPRPLRGLHGLAAPKSLWSKAWRGRHPERGLISRGLSKLAAILSIFPNGRGARPAAPFTDRER